MDQLHKHRKPRDPLFTDHAQARKNRTRLSSSELIRFVWDSNLHVDVHTSKSKRTGRIIDCSLLFSPPDNAFFVVVQAREEHEVVTILPSDYFKEVPIPPSAYERALKRALAARVTAPRIVEWERRDIHVMAHIRLRNGTLRTVRLGSVCAEQFVHDGRVNLEQLATDTGFTSAIRRPFFAAAHRHAIESYTVFVYQDGTREQFPLYVEL